MKTEKMNTKRSSNSKEVETSMVLK